ncbi:aspartyl-phosphate phosphatase Spo0E family protein [Evansella cellulosilytica]|uniref:Sporulation stage 0, Spo0E-like regulatory phosphatase n=1 Tax=Evansella cellulosilytica (strain ATCC 21833 / DSM 2522 / FERM P-1141 / JCM 9156 / N-4) TaxID=649639 RepID=E6TT50_EVAC2|nr:aspartyl-phosphate phosphatase Spo0E family protein [Evansella cellulosilytica]ADU31958.1 Sporulation stage 0, Spo0E-like regulatory phosphatase [Evansella cellulosilytica DSM 2522]
MAESRESLKTKIEDKRKEMIENGNEYGLNHRKTVTNSIELDSLIAKFLKQYGEKK